MAATRRFSAPPADVSAVESTTRAILTDPIESTSDNFLDQMATSLTVYYTPLLVVLGSLGNVLSIVVFFTSSLRSQSTSQYLSALAASDTIFLILLLPPWLKTINATRVFYRDGVCEASVYLCYVSSCLSAWLVVAFTVERFVAVLYPLRRHATCTVRRARITIAAVVAAAFIVNLPLLLFVEPTQDNCDINEKYMKPAKWFNFMDTVTSFTIPLAMIVALNFWIVLGVCRVERARRQLREAQPGGYSMPSRPTGTQRAQQRVTRLLLVVSSAYVLFNVPAYTMRIFAYGFDMESGSSSRWATLQLVAQDFFHTNFGINFLLYCLTGQNFRRVLMQLPCFRRCFHRTSAVRHPSPHPALANSVSTSCTEDRCICPAGSAGRGRGVARARGVGRAIGETRFGGITRESGVTSYREPARVCTTARYGGAARVQNMSYVSGAHTGGTERGGQTARVQSMATIGDTARTQGTARVDAQAREIDTSRIVGPPRFRGEPIGSYIQSWTTDNAAPRRSAPPVEQIELEDFSNRA